MKTLVIGYGNDSRRDDGVGRYVVEQLAKQELPGVELQAAHQLEVELAETLTRYDRVFFVDAAIPEAPAPIQRSVVTPNFQSHAVAHYLTPPDVLSLSQTLYGHAPAAEMFSIRGRDFGFGTELSPDVEQAGQEVARRICDLLLCHSERSEESPLFDQKRQRPFASLRGTNSESTHA
jgi:hydrogenase maturation protease